MQDTTKNLVVAGKGADKKLLSAPQKEFNRLIKSISKTRLQIAELRALVERMVHRAHNEMQPLVDKRNKLDVQLVELLDRMFSKHKFNKTETRKLQHMISTRCHDLIGAGFEELKAIYNRHNPDQDYDSFDEEANEITVTMAKEMVGMMYGINFEEDADVDTPEKMQAYVAAKMAEREEAEVKRKQRAEERRAAKPKTARQLATEAKRTAKEEKHKQEEKKIFQSVREVYMDLVKAFHPDREPDEAEKARKTAILQRVTAAYEDNDLLKLLELQLELERMDGEHLNALADDKLRYFNKNLQRQAYDLNQELWAIEMQIGQTANLGPFEAVTPKRVEREFEKDLKAIKKETKQLQEQLEALCNHFVLKAWLKHYEIHDDSDDFEALMGQLFR